MASNSYGWAQPQTQPAIPINTRYAPNSQTAQMSTQGSAYQPGSYGTQGAPNFQGGGFSAQAAGGYPGGPTNPPMTGMGTPPQGPQNMTPSSMSGAYQPSSNLYGGGQAGDPMNILQQLQNGGWNLNNPATWQGQAKDNLESFMGNYFVPYINASNSVEAQRNNEYNAAANLAEQQRTNTANIGLAQQGQDLQRDAFGFASGPQFQAGLDQFNRNLGLQTQAQKDTAAYQQGQNSNQLLGLNQNYSLGQAANANTAQNNSWNYALGQQQNANTLTGLNQNYDLGKVQNANAAQNNANTLQLGQAANANTAQNNAWNYALGQGQNQNAANANNNTLTLGQGQLGYQNRQLDTTNSFNRDQLAQDATLAYAKNANDLTQARYAAFGRAQAPNSRAALSWY